MTDENQPILGRRQALALGAGALGAPALPGTAAAAAAAAAAANVAAAPAWVVKWNPDVVKDGPNAFEGLEGVRVNSHPGVKHSYTEGDHWRFDMHPVDRDTSTDRQRNEAKGCALAAPY
jgi:hypothetical protein